MTEGQETRDQVLRRLTADVTELRSPGGLLDQLQDRLYSPSRKASRDGLGGGSGFESKPPWDAASASLYFTLLAEAVELEHDLRWHLTGKSIPDRGRSHEAARTALGYVPMLAANQPLDVLRSTSKQVCRRVREARELLGYQPRMIRLEAPCPFCLNQTLAVPADASDDVRCKTDGCVDPRTGEPPRWPRQSWISLYVTLQRQAQQRKAS